MATSMMYIIAFTFINFEIQIINFWLRFLWPTRYVHFHHSFFIKERMMEMNIPGEP